MRYLELTDLHCFSLSIGTQTYLRFLHFDVSDFIGERRSGINQSVMDDVSTVFKGKTLNQLQLLEMQINSKLKGGEGVDVGELIS